MNNSLTDNILKLVNTAKEKTILEVGGHDDSETLDLAKHFKKVVASYEYLKIYPRSESNFEINKTPYLKVLENISKYDVLLMENEFHHFPDIWQMKTYDLLNSDQILLIVEWNGKGTINKFYKHFQNCKPLCELTNQILNSFSAKGIIAIEETLEGKYIEHFDDKQSIIDFYKFMLPDHWKYGEDDFMKDIENLSFPCELWEGYTIYKVTKKVN